MPDYLGRPIQPFGLGGLLSQPEPQPLLPQQGGGLLGPALMNPNLARQGILYRQNMTPPTSVMDPRWADYAKAQEQARAFDVVTSFPGPTEALAGMKALAGALMGKGVLGGMGAVVAPGLARTLNTTRNLPADETFLAAARNTPGAQLTDEGLLMRVMRNQQPEQALEPSVRGGVFYLPEGAAQAKYYSTGKNAYGGKERITGETLIANPLVAKGGTGGKAPEAAYDSLLGKGSYQSMRRDALHWGAGPMDIREEAVTKFLEKYAPEMADQAYYILQNSKQSNQLAYALQEAAVASAARNAGHDAIVGYSTSRSTKQPFISEIFDVRERNYPDKFGSPAEVWDSFTKKP